MNTNKMNYDASEIKIGNKKESVYEDLKEMKN